ncbi:MAG TPA: 6-phosphofructokinase [Bacillota bacterium]|nr:6-phosphofructokinase [Bacillota bacterium]
MNTLIGNAVVGQSGGPTAAINATLAGVIRGVLENLHGGSIRTLFGMRNGIEGLLEERLIDLGGLFASEDKLKLLELTPAAALGSCRRKLPDIKKDPAFYERLLGIFKKYDIRYFFYIGGNDSMDTVARLSEYTKSHEYEMRIIGIPKTIDNDLVGTDHTPGFGSAAKYIATTVQEIIRDCAVYATKAVTIVEIMGRDAGWLTASAALGRAVNGVGPDLIYLPESPFSMEKFFEDLRRIHKEHPDVVVAVSEGIRYEDGRYVCEGMSARGVDVFGHTALSGTGKVLEFAVKDELGCKVRSIELNLPQRCAAHLASAADIEEAVCIGKEAVAAAAGGVTRRMMTIERISTNPYKYKIGHADVTEIANKVKKVNPEFINAEGNNVTDECVEYLLPLIAGEVRPLFDRGIPVHIII